MLQLNFFLSRKKKKPQSILLCGNNTTTGLKGKKKIGTNLDDGSADGGLVWSGPGGGGEKKRKRKAHTHTELNSSPAAHSSKAKVDRVIFLHLLLDLLALPWWGRQRLAAKGRVGVVPNFQFSSLLFSKKKM